MWYTDESEICRCGVMGATQRLGRCAERRAGSSPVTCIVRIISNNVGVAQRQRRHPQKVHVRGSSPLTDTILVAGRGLVCHEHDVGGGVVGCNHR